MRILIISNLYPPIVRGGYEVECSGVVERLSERHDVVVLTSDLERSASGPPDPAVMRELSFLTEDWRGALRAPRAAVGAAAAARRALDWRPDLVYCWNPSNVSEAALRIIADAGRPIAFRVCDHSLNDLFIADQFMRELLPAGRSPARTAWSVGCRALNVLPPLRLKPEAPIRAAISWNSEFIRSSVHPPAFLQPVLERIGHSVPRHGELYAAVRRDPAPEPEIVFLGRVTPYKGLEVAIRALALLASDHGIEAKLLVIGPEDADHGNDMRAMAARLGIAGSVRWLGQRTPEQAAAELARAHALIVPSLWEEPFPLVTIEGALAGVPLVAADVGGISEGMHHEEHALLYPAPDAAAAASALARTFGEPEQTAARVQRARIRARDFTLDVYLEQQERFIDDAVAALSRPFG